jgi:hypothetical protein
MKKIQIPKGYTLDKVENGEIILKELNWQDIKTMDDVYAVLGEEGNIYKGLEDDEIAFIELKLIAKAINGDWVADWSNENERKWIPYFKMDQFSFYDSNYYYWNSYAASALYFQSEEKSNHAAKYFLDVYKRYIKG